MSGIRTDVHPGQTRIRVAIIAPSLEVLGGQAIQADRLLQALERSGSVEALLIPINPRLPPPLRWLQKIKFVRTAVTFAVYVSSLVRWIPSADVVHIFSASYWSFLLAPTPALAVSRLLGRPTILNYHSGEAEDHLTRWGRTAIPTLKGADRIVVPSEYLVEVFTSFGLPASEIPNSLDLSRFQFRPRETVRPMFLSNRNLESHYGVDTVLRAFAIVQKRFENASLVVAGTGSRMEALVELAESLNCRNVRFAGRVTPSAMTELYDRSDVLLNGSEIDNMPLSLLEAQAAGLPVVTSDAGGIPFIVKHESTGLLVGTGDPDAMAQQALRLFDPDGLALRLSLGGRRSVEQKYAMEVVLPAWVSLYRTMTAPPSPSASNEP